MKTNVSINAGGGAVGFVVEFGFASIGGYQAWLYDRQGLNPALVLQGVSSDNVPDSTTFSESANNLQGRILYVRARAASMVGAPESVSATLRVTQGGSDVGAVSANATVKPGQEAVFHLQAVLS